MVSKSTKKNTTTSKSTTDGISNAVVSKEKSDVESENSDAKVPEDVSVEEKKPEGEIVEPAAFDTKEVRPESAAEATDSPSVDINVSLEVDGMDEVSQKTPIAKSNKRLFLLGTVVFIATVVVVTAVGVFWLSSGQGQQKKAVPVEEKVTITPTPKVLKREDWTLEVLNGTGVAGAAKRAADTLGTAGYKISKTGNSADDNKGETQVFVSAGKSKEDRDLLLEDLKSKLNSANYAGELQDSEASVRIILGTK